MSRRAIIGLLAAGWACWTVPASAAPRVVDSNGAIGSTLASDDQGYVAWETTTQTRIYDRNARRVRTVRAPCSVQDLVSGSALIACEPPRRSQLINLQLRRSVTLPPGLVGGALGRFWALARRNVPSTAEPMAQWVWVNRSTRRTVDVGPPFLIRGTGGDTPPPRQRLDTKDLSIAVDPPWIPRDAVIIRRRGPVALGQGTLNGNPDLTLYRQDRAPKRLSTCTAGCRRASLGRGLITWLDGPVTKPRLRAYDGKNTFTVRPRIPAAARILDARPTDGRVFLTYATTGTGPVRLSSISVRRGALHPST